MASVAINLAESGWQVSGSDSQFYPPMGSLLKSSKLTLQCGYTPDNLPKSGLVVVGNAISRGNPELEAALNRNLTLVSLPELLRYQYLPNNKTIVIAGTHGKTTTSSLAAHVLRQLSLDPGWMIGGEPVDLPQSCHLGRGGYFVIEGDEYDTAWFDKRPKFLLYNPYYAILTSIEFDHSDIYPDVAAIEDAFRRFVRLLPEVGRLICNGDDDRVLRIAAEARCPVITYGFGAGCDWRIDDLSVSGSEVTRGRVSYKREVVEFSLNLAGRHNIMNAVAVLILAYELGLPVEEVTRALAEFHGVARRLEKFAESGGVVCYDDFAHHPTAIKTTIEAVRKRHPESRIWALFEPRSNTMVKNYFERELTEALSVADIVMIAPIHRPERIPASERLNLDGVEAALRKLGREAHGGISIDSIFNHIQDNVSAGDVILLMSNGSFGGLKDQIRRLLSGGQLQDTTVREINNNG